MEAIESDTGNRSDLVATVATVAVVGIGAATWRPHCCPASSWASPPCVSRDFFHSLLHFTALACTFNTDGSSILCYTSCFLRTIAPQLGSCAELTWSDWTSPLNHKCHAKSKVSNSQRPDARRDSNKLYPAQLLFALTIILTSLYRT
jgi:hypothetical protein